MEEEFQELFEEKSKFLLNSLVKAIEEIYVHPKQKKIYSKIDNQLEGRKPVNKSTEKDLLDEFYEDKQNKNKLHHNNRKGSKYSNEDNFKTSGWQGHKDDFVVGGKKIVLKGNRSNEFPESIHTNNNNANKKYRERSRENEIAPKEYNGYNNPVNYYNQAFTIPRGFFRNPSIRGGRFPMMPGMHRMPNEMQGGFMRFPGIRPRAPFQKTLE